MKRFPAKSLKKAMKVACFGTLLLLYVVLPSSILLLFRGPEIFSLLQMGHALMYVKAGFLLMAIATWRYGWHGFATSVAIGIGALKYFLDMCLWKPPDDMSLVGKVAVVTGANRGIGLATAKALAAMGAHVVLTCRTKERCQDAVRQVQEAGKQGSARSAVLQLGSLESAIHLTNELTREYPRIHYLFNNAGATPRSSLTNEGFEDGFGGMHLAHMAVTLGLLPSLQNAGRESGKPSRIVMTSSDIAITSACGLFGTEPFLPDFEQDFQGQVTRGDGTIWNSMSAYGRAKLCNILFAFELNRRLAAREWPVVAHALHTGAVLTHSSSNGLFGGIPGLSYVTCHILAPLLWRSTDQAAQTLLFAALSNKPAPAMTHGGQYIDAMSCVTPKPTGDYKNFDKMTVRLWDDKNMTFYTNRWEALQASDIQWASRLFDVSLRLLQDSPAKDVVQLSP